MIQKSIHRFLPLTYKPKIPRVLTGEINQSIRIDTDLQVGDFVAFHGWEGRPYHSSWSFRTPYMQLVMAMPVYIKKNDSVYFPETGETYKRPSGFLNTLAALDGIDPPTAQELIRVIRSMHGKGILHGKILRWDPASIKARRPYCFAFPHLLKDKNGEKIGDPCDWCSSSCSHFEDCQEAYGRMRGYPAPKPIEQVHATIKENVPPRVPMLTPPSQDFIQIGFCKEVR